MLFFRVATQFCWWSIKVTVFPKRISAPVPLAILTWGQRWLGAAESDTTLTHTPCGADLEVVLSCGVCAEPITRDTIALTDDH